MEKVGDQLTRVSRRRSTSTHTSSMRRIGGLSKRSKSVSVRRTTASAQRGGERKGVHRANCEDPRSCDVRAFVPHSSSATFYRLPATVAFGDQFRDSPLIDLDWTLALKTLGYRATTSVPPHGCRVQPAVQVIRTLRFHSGILSASCQQTGCLYALSPTVAACGQSQPRESNEACQCHSREDRSGRSVWQQGRAGEQAGSEEGLPLNAQRGRPHASQQASANGSGEFAAGIPRTAGRVSRFHGSRGGCCSGARWERLKRGRREGLRCVQSSG